MSRVILMYMVFGLLASFEGQSQTLDQLEVSAYSYHPPHEDKEAWQRLNLWLSSTFINITKEAQVDLDSGLSMASRSLGLSRISLVAEGINAPELLEQSPWIDQRNPGTGVRMLSEASGRKRLQLLLLLGAYYAFEPGSYSKYKDSVDYFLNQAIKESEILKEERLGRLARCLRGKIYVQADDAKGDSIYSELISQCREANDQELEARTLAYWAIYKPPVPGNLEKKITDFQKAADLYHRLNNIEGEINVLIDKGYTMVLAGQLQSADEILLKALTLANDIHYPYTHYITEALIAVTFFQGKFGEPLLYTLQTINVAESSRDSIGWSYFYSRLSQLLYTEGRREESLEMAQKAIERFVIDRDPSVFNILTGVVAYLGEEGRAQEALELTLEIAKKVNEPTTVSDQYFYHLALSTCYLNLDKLDLAEIHIKQMDLMETKAEAIRGSIRRREVNDQFATLYLKKRQYGKAREYLNQHFTTNSVIGRDLSSDLKAYRFLITIDSILGNHESEIAHYKQYIQLLDSNYRVTKIRQAEELQVLYETQEKENQIVLLNQQAELEKANLKQATLVKDLTLAGIVTVLVIAGLLLRQNRLRLKNNKLITHQNEQLHQLLGDKEWLLKEIHHRVKNNLQIIMSLLDSQSVYINNDAALIAIHDSQRRVQTISLIHQKLYQSENVSRIAMPQYIDELLSYLLESFDIDSRIVFKQEVEPINLDVSQAIPLGLIINELIVNALKYAFPNGRKGVVSISLQRDQDDYLLLKISDNGIGLPADLDLSAHDSLGLSLINGLAKQLKGIISMENNQGLRVTIRFRAFSDQFSDTALEEA